MNGTKVESRNADYTSDKPAPKRTVERVREWAHGYQTDRERDCNRRDKLIHTPVNKTPDECHACPNKTWESRGVVHRLKETKEVIHREK